MSDQEPNEPSAEKPERLHWIFRVVIGLIIGGFVLTMLVFGTCLLLMKH